jgi:two-component system response regulator
LNQHNKIILMVEDNPDDAELAIMALRNSHLANDIKHVRDGEEALQLLLGQPKSPLPHLVLLDLHMPKVGGLEVLKRLRSNPRTRRLPVVILTSSSEDEDIATSYDLGANSYIRKPIDFDQFSECVKQLGLYWLVMNETPRNR